jgi:hypothetical protein
MESIPSNDEIYNMVKDYFLNIVSVAARKIIKCVLYIHCTDIKLD